MAGSLLDQKEAFALNYQTYEGNRGDKDCPAVAIHGLLGSTMSWHEFCKSYSEQTGRKVQYVILLIYKYTFTSFARISFKFDQ